MIPPVRGKGRIRLMAAAILLLAAAASLYGRGAKENTVLSRADELIAEKEYDEAVSILSDFMKDNPDRFGEAQKRLQKIVHIRENYNRVANELLDVVETDPTNSDRIFELSNQLLAIESPSNPATRLFLDQIRLLAEFRVNSSRLERILLAGRAQLNDNDYIGALDTYASGLDIYQDVYFSSGYGEEAEKVASDGLDQIGNNIRSFDDLADPFSRNARTLADFGVALQPVSSDLAKVYTAFSPYLNEITALQESFSQIKKLYETQLSINQMEKSETGDRSFLSFAGRLINGPVGQNEGMIGTIDRFWNSSVGPVETALTGLVDRFYNAGLSAMRNRDFSGGISAYNETEQYINTTIEVLRKWTDFLGGGDSTSYVAYGETIDGKKLANYLKMRIMSHAIIYLKDAGNLGNRELVVENAGFPAYSSWQQGLITAQAAISQEQAIRQSFQNFLTELKVLDERIRSELETFSFYQETLVSVPGGIGSPQSSLIESRDLVASLNSRFRAMEYDSTIRRYTIATKDLEKRVNDREAEFNEGSRLIQGVIREIEGSEAYTAYYPTEGLNIITRMNQNLEPDINSARDLLAQFTAEDRSVLDAREINDLYVGARDLLARLLSLQSGSNALAAPARTQIQRAASLRFEGDRLFQEAQASLNRNDFDGARSSLSRAAEQYKASLGVQESDSLRNTWDTQLVRLNADIDRIENEVIVQYVRNQINSARNLYFAGNIDQAETVLVNAQNRWRITNTTEHPEVEYWLGLVRGALSLQSGRTIAPTAPLYAEMSQLLSEAKRNYDEGVRLIGLGRRQEGLVMFQGAMDKTREVRLMFPLNHDARLLELRIEQQTDQNAFTAAFRQRLNEAVAGTRPNVRNLESYAELQDLAEINPGYPGLKAILTQAEIDMGFRPPPPDPRDLARSTELTQNAQTNYNSRDMTRYTLALAQLQEAIRLNPNNTQAQRLLDQVSIAMTGTGTIVLPRDVQDQYDVAVRMYNQGNYLQADVIVQRLLQNPANQRYTLILELKRRIDAVL